MGKDSASLVCLFRAVSVIRVFFGAAAFSLLGMAPAQAQIVNIEAMRGATGDSSGTHGILDGQFYLGGAQNVLLRTYGAANVRKSIGNETFYGMASGTWSTRVGGDKLLFESNAFLHGRYNLELQPRLTLEAFFQYQRDRPLRIAQRYNAGFGPRIKTIKAKGWEIYWSPLLMGEFDLEEKTGVLNYALRMSTYVSSEVQLSDRTRWNTVVYYQPDLLRWADFRMVFNTRIQTRLTRRLQWVTSGFINYDAFPADYAGVPAFTFGTTTGLSYRF